MYLHEENPKETNIDDPNCKSEYTQKEVYLDIKSLPSFQDNAETNKHQWLFEFNDAYLSKSNEDQRCFMDPRTHTNTMF